MTAPVLVLPFAAIRNRLGGIVMRRLCSWLVLAGVILVAGCQAKLNVEKSFAMQSGDTQFLLIDAPVGEQKINVAVSSGGVPVNLYVVPGSTGEQAASAIKDKKGVLASKAGAADPAVDATIPAKQAFVVAVETPEKPANVKIKVTSR